MSTEEVCQTKPKVGYVHDAAMAKHRYPTDHPERPERITAIYDRLLSRDLLEKLIQVPSRKATRDELLLAHAPRYIDQVFKLLQLPKRERDRMLIKTLRSPDMGANDHTLSSALIAAGSTLDLVKSIVSGHIDRGIAIVRPPGHHAHRDRASGFCWFNNVAVATMWARNYGRVAVVDWDIHKGDGSYDILQNKRDVFFVSVHRSDYGTYYPGSGQSVDEGNCLLIGLDEKSGDNEYVEIFAKKVVPRLEEYKPDYILVSAGFDAGRGDPLGGYDITPEGFRYLTRMLLCVCPKVALILEGGYNLKTISRSMEACVTELLTYED